MKQTHSVDEVIFALNKHAYFFAMGWFQEEKSDVLETIEFPSLGEGVVLESYCTFERQDVLNHFLDQGISLRKKPVGFMAKFKLPDSKYVRDGVSAAVSDGVLQAKHAGQEMVLKASVLDVVKQSGPGLEFMVGTLKKLFDDSDIERSVLHAIEMKRLESEPPRTIHIESIDKSAGQSLFVNGWLMDCGGKRLYLFDKSNCVLVELQFHSSQRDDVTNHLKNIGLSPKSNAHGFLGLAAFGAPVGSLDGYALAWKEGDEVVFFPLNPGLPTAAHLPSVYVQRMAAQRPESLKGLLFDVIPDGAGNTRPLAEILKNTKTHVFSEVTNPTLSLVVPYHSEMFFIDDLILMMKDAPATYDWVIVCDDLNLVERMRNKLIQHKTSFPSGVKFIVTPGNSGFASACNVGAFFSSSENILFMNSDILIQDFAHVDRAVEYIEAHPKDIAGFTLRFEDETIQHAGIHFRAADSFGGLLLAEHTNKGLPAALAMPKKDEEVLAVTGALMLMRKRTEEYAEYFSSEYINGDFEDVDICLQARSEGGKNMLFVGDGMYHLERQSIGRTSSEKRFMFTLRNSATFTQKWFSYLDQIGEVH